jgi:TPR repeat protein
MSTLPAAQEMSTVPLPPEEVAQLKAKAEEGNPDAQVSLARAYEVGNGVPKSDQQAVKWYRAAAEQGNAKAQNSLALMYRSGRGVNQDKAEAVSWYRKAARQKDPSAMFNLGTAYYNGDGVGVDDVAAFAWFLLAQDFGSGPAVDAIKRMTEEARSLQTNAFEKIGDMYQKGDDLPKSYNDAVNWYRKAAENGEAGVQVKLANLLLHDTTGTPNYAEVHRLCEKAAKQNSPTGAYCVGELYQQGFGVERDLPKAAVWFSQAAKMGLAVAALRLGEMYWKGEGLKQDKISAYEFMYLASVAGVPEATQERERIEKEMTQKELQKGKAKAIEWSHQQHPLALKGAPTVN